MQPGFGLSLITLLQKAQSLPMASTLWKQCMPGAPADVLPTALSTAQEIELRLGKIAQLLEQEQTQAEHARQYAVLTSMK